MFTYPEIFLQLLINIVTISYLFKQYLNNNIYFIKKSFCFQSLNFKFHARNLHLKLKDQPPRFDAYDENRSSFMAVADDIGNTHCTD